MNALQSGPWIIRSQPLILSEWSPAIKLEKREVKKIQVWVKIHDVPIAAYTEDGLSLIASTLGVSKLLDSYTTTMCMDTWGRSSYARALIEITVEQELKEELTIAIPDLDGESFVTEKMVVEYQWTQHRCGHCCVFGHMDDSCRKQIRASSKTPARVDGDGYKVVNQQKAAKRTRIQINKPKVEYQPKQQASKQEKKVVFEVDKSVSKQVKTSNRFDVLNNELNDPFDDLYSNKGDVFASTSRGGGVKPMDNKDQHDEEEEVVEVYNETAEFMVSNNKTGANTPAVNVANG
ncbi:uncharacterized protein LOC110893439 [Helianthus annuus]|uniref:uncharacterized protein LOC110893439 n=1 Tax=Helianthus annuus TaxID=4232 RepID=UPI000B8F6D8A|nr:uncharacterized protein LOC110893439 [Helianthus annuus]